MVYVWYTMASTEPATGNAANLPSVEIAAKLRAEIMESLPSGSRLSPERRLATRFGVARNTVRKAIMILQKEGVVETVQGSGTFVADYQRPRLQASFETARPLELMDARFAFEPHICRLAVLNAKQVDLDSLYELVRQMEEFASDAARFAELDARLHVSIVETTGNPLLVWIASQINLVRGQKGWTKMRELTLGPEIIAAYNVQHRSIVDAISAREPERAASLMKEHLETARLSLTRAHET